MSMLISTAKRSKPLSYGGSKYLKNSLFKIFPLVKFKNPLKLKNLMSLLDLARELREIPSVQPDDEDSAEYEGIIDTLSDSGTDPNYRLDSEIGRIPLPHEYSKSFLSKKFGNSPFEWEGLRKTS
jgi:hypothetical protein